MTSTDGGAPVRRLRVLTFNIRHALGADRRLDLARTARVIADARADVVTLQEVDRHLDARSGFADQAGLLAQRLGMHLAFGANVDRDPPAPGRPRRQFGNAILSAVPILDWQNTHLPCADGRERRGLLRARVEAHGASWQVFATHLCNGSPSTRQPQVEAIISAIGEPTGEPTGEPAGAAVLCGDLNATPGSTEMRALTGRLRDAWSAVRTGRGHTHPSPFPVRRIDYVLCSRGCAVRTASVLGSVRARLASDHLPLVAELEAPPG